MKKPRLKPRNHVALNPLLAKCAVHGKSHKAQRQQKKIDLRRGRYDQSACVRVLWSGRLAKTYTGLVAQLGEQLPFNQTRVGSSPTGPTNLFAK